MTSIFPKSVEKKVILDVVCSATPGTDATTHSTRARPRVKCRKFASKAEHEL